MKHLIPLAASLLLAVSASACASPLAPPTVLPLETSVALTLQAIAAAATPTSSDEPAPLPTPVQDILPHDLYFRNRDSGGLWQIYRMVSAGGAPEQITFEPLNVDSYDVSRADGAIAYITNNQLYLVDAGGADRRMLIDGTPVDIESPWSNRLNAPVWSPDGRTLAYGHGGLTFLQPDGGSPNRVLQNQIDTSAGFAIPREIYAPGKYSVDGSKLLISIGFYEGGTYGIYLPSNNALIRFQRADGGMVCCYVDWIPDGSGAYITSPTLGMVESGLYYADAATGAVTTLLAASLPDLTYNFAHSAQVGPDNKLYFFYNNLPEITAGGRPPLYLVRSEPNGVTDRVQLRPEPFDGINEILWAPDASLALIAQGSDPGEHEGGEIRLVYTDGRPPASLTAFGQDLRWGP